MKTNNGFFVDKGLSVSKFRDSGIKFYETEPRLENTDYLVEFRNIVSKNNLKKNLDLIIRSVGINPDHLSFYHKLIVIIQFIPFVLEKFNIFLGGAASTYKSSPYLVYSDSCFIFEGIPTLASLRGDKNKKSEKALFEEEIICLEELAESDPEKVITLLKNSLQSGEYLDRNNKTQKLTASFIFIGNTYHEFSKIQELENKKLVFQNIPEILIDPAFLDRFNVIICKDLKFQMEEEMFLKNGELGLNINLLMNAFRCLKEKEINLEIDSINLKSPRDYSRVLATTKGLLKILYPESTSIPDYIVNGIAQFAYHLRSVGNEYIAPFTTDSLKFLIELLGVDRTSIDEIALVKDRLLIKYKNENIWHKHALNEWGMEANRIEIEIFTSLENKEHIAQINLKNSTAFKIEQEYYPLYSSNITYDASFNLCKRGNINYSEYQEINLNLIEQLKNCVLYDLPIPTLDLKPWILMSETQLKRKAEDIFKKNICYLPKSTYSYDNKECFKIINFSEYLKPVDKTFR